MTTIFDEPSKRDLPETRFEDRALDTAKVVASLAALFQQTQAFGTIGSVFLALIASPVERRRKDWFEDLARRLRDLEDQVAGFNFDALGRDEQFVSVVLQAAESAQRTHQQQKLEALRNAVLNVALGKEPDADRQQQFLKMVDSFSELHLALLKFFSDPAGYFHAKGATVPLIHSPHSQPVIKLMVSQLVLDAMPSLREKVKSSDAERSAAAFQFIESIIRDLFSNKLIRVDRHQETWSVPYIGSSRDPSRVPVKPFITHLGEDFLAFITEPARVKALNPDDGGATDHSAHN